MSRLRIGAIALLLALLVGCGPDSTVAAPGGSGEPSASGGTVNAGTGPGASSPPARHEPSAKLPTLPIGPGGEFDGEEPTTQCVGVRYLATDDIPEGVSLTVAAVEMAGGGQNFKLGGTCDDPNVCQGFTWTSDNQPNQCWVPVTEIGEWTGSRSITLRLRGTHSCASGDQAACDDFARLIADQNPTAPKSLERRTTTTEPNDSAAPQSTTTN